MGYRWLPITSNFDRSLPFTKIRFIDTDGQNVRDNYICQLPNINTDSMAWRNCDTAAYGYAGKYRFSFNSDMGGIWLFSPYYNESIHTDTIVSSYCTEVETGVWEYEYPHNMYWSGTADADGPISSKYEFLSQYFMVYVQIPFEPSKSILKFSSTGGTDTFELTSDTGWTATTSSDWCSVSPSTGSTGGTITVNCNRNYTTSARTSTITFANANSETFNITVNQKRGTSEKEVNKMYRSGELIFQRQIFSTRLSVSTNSLSFPKTGNTQNVTVKSNIPYTYSSSVDWLTISTASTGITVTVPNYTGSTDRTGTITITANNAGDIVTKTISVEQKVSVLPSKAFLVNYNAKQYDAATHSMPKAENQLFDEDLVLNTVPDAVGDGYLTIHKSAYMLKEFSSTDNNIFNCTGNTPLTIVCKVTKTSNSNLCTLIGNRQGTGNMNWMLLTRPTNTSEYFLHNTNGYASSCPNVNMVAEPNIFAIRVNNGQGNGVSYTDSITGNTKSVTYGSLSNAIGFFTDGSLPLSYDERFYGDFYWMYISKEALTDDEIQQVIDYNENME